MSSLKDRKKAAENAVSGKKGKKPRSQTSLEAARRKDDARRMRLALLQVERGTATAEQRLKEKRKQRRKDQRKANNEARAHNRAVEPAFRVDIPYPNLGKRPPEPFVFTWVDWARERGGVIHCGRGSGKKARKWRLAHPASLVAFSASGRVLVKIPLHLALEVFGKS